MWRIGGKVPLNVYEGNRPMFQCHTPEDAVRIVALLNIGTLAQYQIEKLEADVKRLTPPEFEPGWFLDGDWD